METIEKKYYKYKEYMANIISIHKDERLEYYYYPEIKKFLQSICSYDEKVINVSENKNSSGEHAKVRSVYADKGSLQDLIIVPDSYSYDNPKKPYVTVEIKRPDIDIKDDAITRYNKLKVENYKLLKKQFKKTSYIILTDCITWYLLINNDNSRLTLELSLVELYQNKWVWKREHIPSFWKELIEKLIEFLEKSKENY